MIHHCKRALSMTPWRRFLIQQQQHPVTRYIWNLSRPSDFRFMVRDMDKAMERFERDMIDFFPFGRRFLPRTIAIEGAKERSDAYRINVDVDGFKPEEINISLKDSVLTIKGKMERTSQDGSKFQQEFIREFTLPENVDPADLKSFLGNDGTLSIEAAYKPSEKPQEIPVNRN